MDIDPLENLFKKAAQVTLDKDKKESIHQEVLVFIKNNPMLPPQARFAFFTNLGLQPVRVALASFLLVLVFGGVASARADSALPGDFLYPVKLQVNEKIKQVLAFSDQAKLEVNVKLAKVRLQEAEQLMVKDKVTPDIKASLEDNFNSHTAQASKYIDKLSIQKSKKVESAASDFEASLKAHGLIIEGLAAKKAAKGQAQDPLLNSVHKAAAKISADNTKVNKRAQTQDELDREIATQEKINTIEKSITKVKKTIKERKNNLGEDAVLQSQKNLHLVEQKLEEGKKKLEQNKNDHEGVSASLKEASVIARESEHLLDAKTELGVDIPINIEADK